LAENPERAFSGSGNRRKYEARIAELEELPGQAHAENEMVCGADIHRDLRTAIKLRVPAKKLKGLKSGVS